MLRAGPAPFLTAKPRAEQSRRRDAGRRVIGDLSEAMHIAAELFVILVLILLNGAFALSELALVSANRARLAVMERKGVAGRHGRARSPTTLSVSCRRCRSASR